ncbi:(+)-germacrene D synthase-like [Musa acuminata AAA Group]|uniref:(+)-germacrene D synthase-like n=1 Tax=Musa acuminata AAA Group TaxID=214697 RepID=UPI0031D5034C
MESLSLQSLVPDDELMVRKSEECDTTIKERVAELMEQIRSMSKDPTDILQTMNLVDSIQLLGLDYRFEKEISEALNHIHDAHIDDHDVFNKFKDEEGNLVSTVKDDPKGLLSLYNAACLRIHEETILDEAISFTRDQLASMLSDLTPPWWNDLFLSKNRSFARDRVVECYYWMLTVYFEPHYSRARVITTKVMTMTSILDDIYDLYSTLEESQLLTEAIQRSVRAVDCAAIKAHNTVGGLKQDMDSAVFNNATLRMRLKVVEFSFIPTQLNTTAHNHLYMKDLSEAYFEESKWSAQHCVPTLEKYLPISLISSTYPILECASFVGMGEIATKEAFEWITSFPKIVQAAAIIGHIMNDITSHEFKDEGGSFMSTLGSDVKGLLSLYNAAYLGTHGEIILDEAISFTRNYLVSASADLKRPLTTQVSLDLETPL